MKNLNLKFSSVMKTGKEMLCSYVRHPHNYPSYLAKKGKEYLSFYTACAEIPLLSFATIGLTNNYLAAMAVGGTNLIARGAQILNSRRLV